jgi:hypothetical protein
MLKGMSTKATQRLLRVMQEGSPRKLTPEPPLREETPEKKENWEERGRKEAQMRARQEAEMRGREARGKWEASSSSDDEESPPK